jgi:hypothetical protein
VLRCLIVIHVLDSCKLAKGALFYKMELKSVVSMPTSCPVVHLHELLLKCICGLPSPFH